MILKFSDLVRGKHTERGQLEKVRLISKKEAKGIPGPEYLYLDALWTNFSARPDSFPKADKKYYADQYARPGRMKAGFAWFSAFPQDTADNKALSKTKILMPVLAMGGEKSLGQPLVETLKVAAQNVQGKVIANCGHWMLEECPAETIQVIQTFLESK